MKMNIYPRVRPAEVRVRCRLEHPFGIAIQVRFALDSHLIYAGVEIKLPLILESRQMNL